MVSSLEFESSVCAEKETVFTFSVLGYDIIGCAPLFACTDSSNEYDVSGTWTVGNNRWIFEQPKYFAVWSAQGSATPPNSHTSNKVRFNCAKDISMMTWTSWKLPFQKVVRVFIDSRAVLSLQLCCKQEFCSWKTYKLPCMNHEISAFRLTYTVIFSVANPRFDVTKERPRAATWHLKRTTGNTLNGRGLNKEAWSRIFLETGRQSFKGALTISWT